MTQTKSAAAWFSRRKVGIFFGIVFAVVLFFVIREKYFYRADGLTAVVAAPRRPPNGEIGVKVVQKTETSIWSWFGVGKKNNEAKKSDLNVWDEFMLKNPRLISIGDIWDKCDNKTRIKIGKVVLAPNKGEGVHIVSYANQTFQKRVTKSSSHLKVYYKDTLLYEKTADMCEKAKKLDTPYECPIPKGHTIIIKDTASMPSYIPKGKYTIDAFITDQDDKEIGCTHAEFKTGEDAGKNR